MPIFSLHTTDMHYGSVFVSVHVKVAITQKFLPVKKTPEQRQFCLSCFKDKDIPFIFSHRY